MLDIKFIREHAAELKGAVKHKNIALDVDALLEADAKRVSGVRLLPGNFMEINQALATPKSREAAHAYLCDFIEEMKRSGFVADALARHQIKGAAVAALADQ